MTDQNEKVKSGIIAQSLSENTNPRYPSFSTIHPPPPFRARAVDWKGARISQKGISRVFAAKPLKSHKTPKENPWKKLGILWKKLGNPWKKLGNPWKKLGKVWKSLERLGAAPVERWMASSLRASQ